VKTCLLGGENTPHPQTPTPKLYVLACGFSPPKHIASALSCFKKPIVRATTKNKLVSQHNHQVAKLRSRAFDYRDKVAPFGAIIIWIVITKIEICTEKNNLKLKSDKNRTCCKKLTWWLRCIAYTYI
jgi:hypothetical protein